MHKVILSAMGAVALASPGAAADMPVPRYSDAPGYEREVQTRDYRPAPPIILDEPAPDTVVVRRPIVIAPPPVVVEEYPVYAVPRVYAVPPAYAYTEPVWRGGWGHRRHFYGRW